MSCNKEGNAKDTTIRFGEVGYVYSKNDSGVRVATYSYKRKDEFILDF